MPAGSLRDKHFHWSNPVSRPRTEAERDRDRLLHSTALRRLAEVSQVVSAQEGHVFHNRLTHVLKVSQIARGLAHEVLDKGPESLVRKLGGVDPFVAEAAALCHDLGHPPFGHTAEQELDELVTKADVSDGFEGNAQSFRIITKLARHRTVYGGLNLTAAALNAVLKYPWLRAKTGKRSRKWGAYRSERKEFEFARSLTPDDQKSAEAEIMDWADDIAYSVFDVEDFFRAGKIPLDRIFSEKGKVDDSSGGPNALRGVSSEGVKFMESAFLRWGTGKSEREKYYETFRRIARYFPMEDPFHGTQEERGALRAVTSTLVSKYIQAFHLNQNWKRGEPRALIDPDDRKEIEILKELTWHYVIADSALMTQQHGFREIIRGIFDAFRKAVLKNDLGIFPVGVQQELKRTRKLNSAAIRIITDFISGMTEQQAIAMHQRLTGVSAGSILKPVA